MGHKKFQMTSPPFKTAGVEENDVKISYTADVLGMNL